MKNIKIVVSLSILATLLVVGVVSAEFSLKDKIAQVAGVIIGEKLASEIDAGEVSLSAMSSPEVYSYMRVHGNFWWGATNFATTTTSTTETIAAGDLMDYGYWDVMSNVGSLTYTLPATSTMMSILPEVGSSRTWLFHNATTTAATTLTIAAGAGMDIVGVAGAEVIDGTEWAELTCTQIYYRAATNENIICIMTELER